MFFISPVAALRNVRQSLVPGGKLCMVVWRRREDNHWLYRAQQIVEGIVQKPGGVRRAHLRAGPVLDGERGHGHRRAHPRRLGGPVAAPLRHRHPRRQRLDEAIDLVMSIGPAGEILRLQGDRAAHLVPKVEAALREGLAEFVRDDGPVWALASTWIVTATAPAG